MEPPIRLRAARVCAVAAAALAAIAMSAGSALALPVHYFVVAENPSRFDPCTKCDSFLLPLTDLDDIEAARAIIARGGTGLGTIVVAEIAAGSDGINRDVLAPGEPLWSWHVTEFVAFADGVIEILDGWPAFVESDVAGWIANTNFFNQPPGVGHIGFENYTVVAELPIPEPGSLVLLGSACALLAWGRLRSSGVLSQARRPRTKIPWSSRIAR